MVIQVVYQQQVYIFHVLNQRQLDQYSSEIQILLNQVTLTLILDHQVWRPKNTSNGCSLALANVIGTEIEKHYRLY
jgi:hypothetical protein